MEPMALGSPPASPGTSPGLNPNFLPAFLMGDNQQTSTPQRTTNPSPSRNRSLSFRTPTSGQEQRTMHPRLFSQTQEQSSFNMNMSSANERAGPPAKGLFDTIDGREFASPARQDSRPNYTSPIREDQRQSFGGQNFSRNLNDSLSRSYRKPNDNIESLWVTILGFPPHAASLVLAQFSQCGTIQDKKFPPEGNWVHIKYSSRHEVAKALSYNGKLISNSIMVGVIPCSINENKENSMNETIQITSPNRARSLTQPYMPNQSNGEVLSPQNVPQKSTGIVTKAMEYVFGW